MNKIFLIGRLVANPELKNAFDNVDVCTFAIAVNYKDAGKPSYFNISVWPKGDLVPTCYKYLQKGARVFVSGRLIINEYLKDDIKKINVEVRADEVAFLSPKKAEKKEQAK